MIAPMSVSAVVNNGIQRCDVQTYTVIVRFGFMLEYNVHGFSPSTGGMPIVPTIVKKLGSCVK